MANLQSKANAHHAALPFLELAEARIFNNLAIAFL